MMPVYFIQQGDDGPVKIGFSKSPWSRLSKIKTDSHNACRIARLFDGGLADEADLHKRFAEQRLHGEWFAPAVLAAEIALPSLSIEKPRASRPCGSGWSVATLAAFRAKRRESAQDPVVVARRRRAARRSGAMSRFTAAMNDAVQAIEVGSSSRVRRRSDADWAKMAEYAAEFPDLVTLARAESDGGSFVARRFLKALDAMLQRGLIRAEAFAQVR